MLLQAISDADPTLGTDTINTAAFDANEAVDITLPPAKVGAYVVWRQSALADEANAMDWICAGTDTFEANQVCSIGELAAQHDTTVGTDVKLIITPAAQSRLGCTLVVNVTSMSYSGQVASKGSGMETGTGAVVHFICLIAIKLLRERGFGPFFLFRIFAI